MNKWEEVRASTLILSEEEPGLSKSPFFFFLVVLSELNEGSIQQSPTP